MLTVPGTHHLLLDGDTRKHTWLTAYSFGHRSKCTGSVPPLSGKIGTPLSVAHLREIETAAAFPHCAAEAVAAEEDPHFAAGAAAAAEALAVTAAVAEALTVPQAPLSIGLQALPWSMRR